MRRRGRSSEKVIAESEGGEMEKEEKEGFYACYLLTSLSPRHKGQTYIGFTVNPRRRIRQHNGEIRCGARRTKLKRPWEMVLCIYGFPSNVSALQFEWAWQHPRESLAVRKAASSFKSLSGVANKIKLAYTMLTLPIWQNLNLTVNFLSTKYMKHTASCPKLPEQIDIQVRCMDNLPCYKEGWLSYDKDEEEDERSSDDNGHGKASTDIPPSCRVGDRHSTKKTVCDPLQQVEENNFRQATDTLSETVDHTLPGCPLRSLEDRVKQDRKTFMSSITVKRNKDRSSNNNLLPGGYLSSPEFRCKQDERTLRSNISSEWIEECNLNNNPLSACLLSSPEFRVKQDKRTPGSNISSEWIEDCNLNKNPLSGCLLSLPEFRAKQDKRIFSKSIPFEQIEDFILIRSPSTPRDNDNPLSSVGSCFSPKATLPHQSIHPLTPRSDDPPSNLLLPEVNVTGHSASSAEDGPIDLVSPEIIVTNKLMPLSHTNRSCTNKWGSVNHETVTELFRQSQCSNRKTAATVAKLFQHLQYLQNNGNCWQVVPAVAMSSQNDSYQVVAKWPVKKSYSSFRLVFKPSQEQMCLQNALR